MCQFFKKRGYPDSAVTTGKHRAQEIDREAALQASQNEETDRIPFTLTYHPQNLAIKHGGARPPPVCAHRAWVDFFKMAPKTSGKAYGFRHIGF